MRIGLIAPPWIPVPPPAYGGTELVVDALARGLAAAGHEVLLAAPSDSTCPVPLVPDLQPADSRTLGFTDAELAHVVRAYAAMADMDLVHDHTLAGPLYRHRPVLPVVATNHGPFNAANTAIYAAASRDVAVVAISRHQASTATGVRVARVIHHGMELGNVPVGDGGGYACFLGRVNPDKGIAQAISIARTAGMPLKIAAKMREPAEIDYYDSVIRPQLGSDVEFLGEITPQEKYALLGGAAAMLNPIQWDEPFGLVMIEALATGTPVVGTPRGAAPEIIVHGRTGFLTADLDQLAGFLQQAPDLDRAQCRAHVERHFSARRMVEDHLQLYADVLAGGTGLPAVPEAAAAGLPGTVRPEPGRDPGSG
ncbi:glycosyltransferase family 4 protein [Arthrobacter mobilis]|uniref:Glycosyltransferase family 4 protein n=1 Tax=Arthrobacter mobilis TaxID=2724944 RepID=A0A7X6K5Q9_9MICC|nr:glycosyltransferase family 4 protein [Arthrobacter mobilis]NKX54125.1 glycosyltransferase family 4 protein [Arthrobacter mobilis]